MPAVSDFDIIIVGAGPGGSTAATHLARKGRRVLLLDKSSFPRDKVCGDAISGKSVDALKRLGIMDRMVATTAEGGAVGSWGVTFGGPYGAEASIPLAKSKQAALSGDGAPPDPPAFIATRLVFDQIVFDAAVESGATVWQEATVKNLLREGEQVVGVRVSRGGEEVDVRAPLVIGADGAYSVVARELGMEQLVERHYCAGLRAYYTGVTGFRASDYLEVHFVDEAMPGYFWIFPLPDGGANVGVGMLAREVKKRDVKLKPLLDWLVAHPRFAHRFENAERIGPVKGFGLPLGSKPRPLAGDGWMLVGDAGSLIDPFSGEGIGNAMVSAEKAAEWADRALAAQDFSERFLKGYGKDVLAYLGSELRLSYTMQKLGRWKWLLEKVVHKADTSPAMADAISMMFDDETERKKLANPLFYLKALTS
jgi:geranylgeranyl reductase family protein